MRSSGPSDRRGTPPAPWAAADRSGVAADDTRAAAAIASSPTSGCPMATNDDATFRRAELAESPRSSGTLPRPSLRIAFATGPMRSTTRDAPAGPSSTAAAAWSSATDPSDPSPRRTRPLIRWARARASAIGSSGSVDPLRAIASQTSAIRTDAAGPVGAGRAGSSADDTSAGPAMERIRSDHSTAVSQPRFGTVNPASPSVWAAHPRSTASASGADQTGPGWTGATFRRNGPRGLRPGCVGLEDREQEPDGCRVGERHDQGGFEASRTDRGRHDAGLVVARCEPGCDGAGWALHGSCRHAIEEGTDATVDPYDLSVGFESARTLVGSPRPGRPGLQIDSRPRPRRPGRSSPVRSPEPRRRGGGCRRPGHGVRSR